MTTRYLVDPELVAMLDLFPTLVLTDENLGQIRAMLAAMFAELSRMPLSSLTLR